MPALSKGMPVAMDASISALQLPQHPAGIVNVHRLADAPALPKSYRVYPAVLDTHPLHPEKFAQRIVKPEESLRRPVLSIADRQAIADAWIITVVYTIFLGEKLRLSLNSDSRVLLTWPDTGTAQSIGLSNGDWPSKGKNLLTRVPRSPAPDRDPNFLWLRRHSIQTGNKSFGQFSKHGRGVAGKGNLHVVNRQ